MISIYRKLRFLFERRIKQQVFQGNNVHCFCCGGNFITFLPGGVLLKRANALCPQCGALERHRLIWRYLEVCTNLFKEPAKLLHVAPEKLFYRKFKENQNIEYVPCAKFGEGYEDKYPEGTINIDITNISLPDNSFDAILCSHVLEHIPDDSKAMQELFRILKPGGWAILQVPLDVKRNETYEDFSITGPKEREQAFGQHDHVRVYGNDYEQRLLSAGFKVKREKFAYTFSKQDLFQYGIIPEDIFFCTK